MNWEHRGLLNSELHLGKWRLFSLCVVSSPLLWSESWSSLRWLNVTLFPCIMFYRTSHLFDPNESLLSKSTWKIRHFWLQLLWVPRLCLTAITNTVELDSWILSEPIVSDWTWKVPYCYEYCRTCCLSLQEEKEMLRDLRRNALKAVENKPATERFDERLIWVFCIITVNYFQSFGRMLYWSSCQER